jgi:O-antigen/teichoic acid export membrane protein
MATPNHYSSPQDDPLTMHRFSTHVAWTFATRIVMIVSSVGASVIVARWLGPEGFGTLAVINVTVAVALQLGSAGLPSANTYFIARDKSRLGAVWANALVFGIVIGSILTLVVILLFNLKPSLFGYVWFPLIVIGAAAIPFQLISLLGLNVFLGMNRIVNFNVLDAASQSFVLLNAAIALVVFGKSLRLLISLNTAASILMALVIVWMTHRMLSLVRDGQPFRIDLGLFRKMARYGIKFHVAVVAAMLIFRADLLIVNHFRSTSEVGVYAVASQVATLLMLLPGVIGTLLLPRVASSVDEGGAITMRVTRHTAFIMLLICLAAAPSSFLIPYIYGAEFNTATLLFLILLPGIFLIGIESVLVQYFSSIGLPVAIPVFWIITLGLNVALNLMFVPVFGARAAAVVSSISYALIFSLVISYFRVKTGNSLSETILIRRGELRDLLRTLAAAKRVQ